MKAFAARAWAFFLAVVLRIRADEPLRNRLRPIIALVAAYLVSKGFISEEVADVVTGLVLLVLGYGAVEWARKLVMPLSKVGPLVADRGQTGYEHGVQDAVEAVTGELSDRADAALKSLPPEIQVVLDRAREAGTYFGNRGEHRAGD